MSLRARLLATFGLMAAVGAAAFVGLWLFGVPVLGIEGIYAQELQRSTQALEALAERERDTLERWSGNRRRELRLLAGSEALACSLASRRGPGAEGLARQLRAVKEASPGEYQALLLLEAGGGGILASADTPAPGLPPGLGALLREAAEPGRSELVSLLPEGGGQGILILNQVQALDDQGQPTGRLLGVLAGVLALGAPVGGDEAAIRQVVGPRGDVLLLDPQGQVLLSATRALAGADLSAVAGASVAGTEGMKLLSSPRGGELMVIFRHLHLGAQDGLSLAVIQRTDEALAANRATFLRLAVLGLVLFASAMGLIVFSANRLAASEAEVRALNASLEARVRQRTLELSEANGALQVAKERAEAFSKAKTSFLSNMSHELRTPLSAIMLYGDLIKAGAEESGNARILKDVGKVELAGKHLLSLINDLLDLAKIEAGKMTLSLDDFDLQALVVEAVSTVSILASTAGNELTCDLDPALGRMRSDPTKLRQVLVNLLSNANKFTSRGRITVTARRERRSAGADREARCWVRLEVTDTGIGIDPAQLPRIFGEFTQAEEDTSRRFGGTGLGLALSQKFCRLLGGDIEVASEPGRGSTFTVRLPLECPPPEGDGPAGP